MNPQSDSNITRSSRRTKYSNELITSTDGCVIISDSFAKQLSTDSATDWNINLGQPSGLSLLRSMRARNWNPIPCNMRNVNISLSAGKQWFHVWLLFSMSYIILYLTFIRCNLAFLSQSTPLTNFGTRNNVANFSVSVWAASNALRHFFTGSTISLVITHCWRGIKCFDNSVA